MLEATITQQIINFLRIEQKGMTFDFDLHSPFLLPSFLGGKIKGKRRTKVVVKSHAFLLDPFLSHKNIGFIRLCVCGCVKSNSK